MRTAFVKALVREARANPDVCLLTGDLGFGVLEPFAEEFPDQFLNCGVAEQSMIGVAAGMASTGKRVFVYSIANFPTLRCLEQIRNDLIYHQYDVTVVSIGAGFAYGTLGYSHFGLEDLGVIRALPEIDVICPSDPHEVDAIVRSRIAGEFGPSYLRLGKAGEIPVHSGPIVLDRGESVCLKEGGDVVIAACGSILSVALRASEALAKDGCEASVISVPYLRPMANACIEAATTCGLVTVEEHSRIGGLGSAVLDAVVSQGGVPRMRVVGVPSEVPRSIGSRDYLLEEAGVTVGAVIDAAMSLAC